MACDEHQHALAPSMANPASGATGFEGMIGQSAEMRRLFRTMAKVAPARQPLLLLGEGGTGKQTAARAIHAQGRFAGQPFLPFACGSVPTKLMELELFARFRRPPWVSNNGSQPSGATVGTVFLDEVDALPPDFQAKLVHALQERETRAVDDPVSAAAEARIIAASSRDLEIAVQQGTFRRDLYLRLNVMTLRFPALRDRRNDICPLAQHFLARIGAEKGVSYSLSHGLISRLLSYDWPGNLDELKNSMEDAVTKSLGTTLEVADFTPQAHPSGLDSRNLVSSNRILPLAEVEKQTILSALKQLNGDKLLTARALGIGKTTLYRKLREYGVVAS